MGSKTKADFYIFDIEVFIMLTVESSWIIYFHVIIENLVGLCSLLIKFGFMFKKLICACLQ